MKIPSYHKNLKLYSKMSTIFKNNLKSMCQTIIILRFEFNFLIFLKLTELYL